MPVLRSDLDLVARALNGLSANARADLLAVWSEFDLSDPAKVRAALWEFWPELVAHYGEMAAVLAADVFELQAEQVGVVAQTQMVRPVDAARANARAGWALSTVDQLGNLTVLLDELVKQPYRSTFANSAVASGAGWARVPHGAETCAFCMILASRGAVYKSARTAGRGTKFHGDCDCAVVLVRDERDYPDGYDPDGLYQRYLDARSEAQSDSTNKVLSALREIERIN